MFSGFPLLPTDPFLGGAHLAKDAHVHPRFTVTVSANSIVAKSCAGFVSTKAMDRMAGATPGLAALTTSYASPVANGGPVRSSSMNTFESPYSAQIPRICSRKAATSSGVSSPVTTTCR
jgi:hypothetical protein